MSPRRIVLIGGGVRSGKSAFALELAQRLGERRVFIATATASDDEMKVRIDRHQRERGASYDTIEAPRDLAGAVDTAAAAGADVVVVDCVTHWISNLLLEGRSAEEILEQTDGVVRALSQRRSHAVLVTNEVGMSIHPPTAIGRAFVEICGWVHQRLARAADDVYLAVLGTVVRIRGSGEPAHR